MDRFERYPGGKPTGLGDGLDMGMERRVTDDFWPSWVGDVSH